MIPFDYIVVGAGSAGATISARLSEDEPARILLIEAGPDYLDQQNTPPDLLDSHNLPALDHDWLYSAIPVKGRSIPYRRGRVIGGTSAINAAAALRGREADFTEWERLGNSEWSWKYVQPYFERLEQHPDNFESKNGGYGSFPISRYTREELIPIQEAYYRACRAQGFRDCPDHNEQKFGGVGPWPMNRNGRTRISTAISHLALARSRPNLTIRANCLVNRLLLKNKRVVGVELSVEGRSQTVLGGRVILCAGAIGSPTIMMRSGIGPKKSLEKLGVNVEVNLPGVGARLWDHAAVPIRLIPNPGECVIGRDPRFQIMAKTTATNSTIKDDLMFVLVSHLDLRPIPALRTEAGTDTVAVLMVALMAPQGHGRLELASLDPNEQPRIDLDFTSDPEDTRRLIEGMRRSWGLVTSTEMAEAYHHISGLSNEIVQSDKRLITYIKNNVGTLCHASGTLPMGSADEEYSVTDQKCWVHGVESLLVVDASVMPAIPRVVPNLSVIMIAERVADWLKQNTEGVSA